MLEAQQRRKWPPLLPIDSIDTGDTLSLCVWVDGNSRLSSVLSFKKGTQVYLAVLDNQIMHRLPLVLLCANSTISHILTATVLWTSLQPWTLTWACARPPHYWTSSTRSDGSSLSRPRRLPITTTASRWPIYRWVPFVFAAWNGGWSKQGGAEGSSDLARRLVSNADAHFYRSRLWVRGFSPSVGDH